MLCLLSCFVRGVAVSNLCRCLVLSCLITVTNVGTLLPLGPGEVMSLLQPGTRGSHHLARSSRGLLPDCENRWMVCSSSVEQSLSCVSRQPIFQFSPAGGWDTVSTWWEPAPWSSVILTSMLMYEH